MQVQNQSEVLCLDPFVALNSSQSAVVLSIRIMETLQKGGISQSFPVFNICVCTFNRRLLISFADADPLCYPALFAHNITAPVELAIAAFAASLL